MRGLQIIAAIFAGLVAGAMGVDGIKHGDGNGYFALAFALLCAGFAAINLLKR